MKKIFSLLLPIVLFACNPSGKETHSDIAGNDTIRYAQGFRIETHTDFQILQIMNPWHSGKVLQTYILVPKNEQLPDSLPEGLVIRTPLQRTVAFSSVVCGMMNELQVLPSLVGVTESQYIVIPEVQKAVNEGNITDVGMAGNPNIERLLMLNAEVVFANPINESSALSIEKLQVPVISCLEWMENHPLGQAEWVRVFGLLFDKQAFADSLFRATEQSYNDLRTLSVNISHRPTVMTEKKYGDFWYQPGGESYFAQLLNAAGADYLFKSNKQSGS
ncbi:MAG: ABC transporter substrate-binding protein, partial [Candidatus Symbiothrix sp.]|nr:ABC transporter substrate-binding protein [Candidatus Symbiothrix sp.]